MSKRAFRLASLAAIVLLLGACATGMPKREAQIALPPAYERGPETVPAPTAALDQWWTLYDDPQLTALVTQALAQGFSVREAQARLAEARALRASALSAFDPQGNLQGSAAYQETHDLDHGDAPGGSPALAAASGLGVSRTAGVSLPVRWEIDFFGRREAARGGADADLESAQFDVEGARAAIAAEVARSLFQSRGLEVQVEETLQTLRIQRELFDAVAERARRGLAASSEVDRVAADLAQAEAQAEDLRAASRASRRALLALLGNATAPLETVEARADLGRVPPIPAAVPGELLARRPDVRLAETRVRKAASSVRLAELDFFPRFTLAPGIGLSAQRGAIDATTGFWSIGAGLTLPILDRPRLHAQLDAQGARAEQSVLAYERVVQTAFSEADQSLTRLQADRKRVETLSAGVERARMAYDAARRRYQLGFATLQELLDGERAWRATRSALTAARLDALQRSVQVFQALGGGWQASAPQQIKG